MIRYRPDTDDRERSFEMIPDTEGDYAAYEDVQDVIKELEALNVLLLAERDTLEAENTMFRMSNDANASKAQRLEARVAKLEAELAEAREALRQINASVPSDGEEYLTECGRCIASAEIADAALTGEGEAMNDIVENGLYADIDKLQKQIEELAKMVDNLNSVIESDEKLVEELTEKLKATEEEMLFWRRESRRLREQYNSLIFEVSYKFPGESRHDTAKRYIREREEHGIEIVAKQALKEASHEG